MKATVSRELLTIPTYPEGAYEEMPMFAENRVHQRTSGNPYPNKVVLQVNRDRREDREYRVVRLENDYVSVFIMPEIGGRIYAATDKRTGYDYFYRQHVIKPALIGVLGSWISGGVEFNWPFHHSPSGFMKYDFTLREHDDGSAECILFHTDPIDRMNATLHIVLRPESTVLETRMQVYNRTSVRRSFLWWENAAVPVNEQYRIFFPPDVTYVNFHYLKSRATFPVAGNVVYNGIPMKEDRDISWHKNTREATTYFASASDFDFFGGYDYGKRCGVVHIGDHYVSPGKKMFTWAYGQLSKSWENALTDEDGQYAELMAGSYSDNQPNFSWLEPYETKQFSQFWYPISEIGSPSFANAKCAFRIDRETGAVHLLTTENENVRLTVSDVETGKTAIDVTLALKAGEPVTVPADKLSGFVKVTVEADGEILADYEEREYDRYHTPDVIDDMPSAASMTSADELYLAGTHVTQYRDPATSGDPYFLRAIERDPNHAPSLIALAESEYRRGHYDRAKTYAMRAIKRLNLYNERNESGRAYYVYAQIAEALGNEKEALDYYHKASWAADSVARAMTRIASLDLKRNDAKSALRHAETALIYGTENRLATAERIVALDRLGRKTEAAKTLENALKAYPTDPLFRALDDPSFIEKVENDPAETAIDVALDLSKMGENERAFKVVENAVKMAENSPPSALYTILGLLCERMNGDPEEWYRKADGAPIGKTFPSRPEEAEALRRAIKATDSDRAKYLLGCYLYHNRSYAEAAALWEAVKSPDEAVLRSLAVAYFSHLGRQSEALPLMKRALALAGHSEQLLYETVVLMDKLSVPATEKIALLESHTFRRDDLTTELAKAYNQALRPEKAIDTLMAHSFVPCEGGEHAIADQYVFAHLVLGRRLFSEGKTEEARKAFVAGQTLPQVLGAGFWNHVKRVPLRYEEARCLEVLGRKEEADAIYSYVAGIEIEYFSKMHLYELPYYQAMAWRHLGNETKATEIVTRFGRAWATYKDTVDNENFGTTPFFCSFIDDAESLRLARHLYLNALMDSAKGNLAIAAENMQKSAKMNTENLFALYFQTFGFLQ